MATNLFSENSIAIAKPQEQAGLLQTSNSKSASTDKDFANLLDSLKDNLDKTKDTPQKQDKISETTSKDDSPKEVSQDETDVNAVKKDETGEKAVEAEVKQETSNDIATEIEQNTTEAQKADEAPASVENTVALPQSIEAIIASVVPKVLDNSSEVQTSDASQTDVGEAQVDTAIELDVAPESEEKTILSQIDLPEADANSEVPSESENVVKADEAPVAEVEDTSVSETDNFVASEVDDTVVVDKNQKSAGEKVNDKINQEILDDMETTIKSVTTQADTSSFSGSGSRGNAQEDAIKYSIKGLDSQLSAIGNNDASTQSVFGKALDSAMPNEVSKSDIMSQINSKLDAFKDESVSKVNIVLKPESLGRVNIEIMSSKDGLTAKIIAQTPEARDILSKNIENLKNTMQAQGVNVNNISVKIEEAQNASQGSLNFEQEAFNKQSSEQGNQAFESQNQGSSANSKNDTLTIEDVEQSEETISTHNGSINISV